MAGNAWVAGSQSRGDGGQPTAKRGGSTTGAPGFEQAQPDAVRGSAVGNLAAPRPSS